MNTALSTCPRFVCQGEKKRGLFVGDLAPKILELVARLSGREESGLGRAPSRDWAAMEGAYREALGRWFELAAQGSEANRAEVARLYQQIIKLIDEVGEPTATTLRRQWARQWWSETGICPWCGERGPFHNPEPGAAPA